MTFKNMDFFPLDAYWTDLLHIPLWMYGSVTGEAISTVTIMTIDHIKDEHILLRIICEIHLREEIKKYIII